MCLNQPYTENDRKITVRNFVYTTPECLNLWRHDIQHENTQRNGTLRPLAKKHLSIRHLVDFAKSFQRLFDEMTVDEMSVDEMTFDEMTGDEMTGHC